MTRVAAFVVLAYLCGSIPSGFLAGRRAGVDLTERGSGNLGSANVYRVLGPAAAFPVLVVDLLKGFLPVWYFPLHDGSAAPYLLLLYGAAAVAGHVWSGFLRFQGGKGIATAAGVLFALSPVTGLVAGLVWTGVVVMGRVPSVASLTTVTLLPLMAWGLQAGPSTIAFAGGLVPFVWWTHRENLVRIRRGNELLLGQGDPPGDSGEGDSGNTPAAT